MISIGIGKQKKEPKTKIKAGIKEQGRQRYT
jgi:hypothetical protein